jgi:subfamily B ATP-binding cassette protein MsbA
MASLHLRSLSNDTSPAENQNAIPRLKRLWRLARVPTSRLIFCGVLLFVNSLLRLPVPFLTKYLIDEIIPHKRLFLLIPFVSILLLVSFILIILELVRNYNLLRISLSIVANIQVRLLEHIQLLPLRYIQAKDIGYLMSRFFDDAGSLDKIITDTLLNTLQQIVLLLTGTIATFYLDWKLALLSSLVLPPFMWINTVYGARVRKRSNVLQEQRALTSKVLHDALAGVFVTKTCLREERQLITLFRSLRRTIRADLEAFLSVSQAGSIIAFLSALGPLIVLAFGSYQVIKAELSLGTVIAFNTMLGYLYGPCQALAGRYIGLQASLVAVNRVCEVLETDPEPRRTGPTGHAPVLPEEIKGEVYFDHVSFAYEPAQIVLRDLTATIHAGEIVALLGESGAGKSTVARLLLRLHNPQFGKIYLDGHDITQLDLRWLRRQIGIVSQESFLFNTSVRENIGYGHAGASEADVIEAAKLANAHGFISALPQGYLTDVGPQGSYLSAGQRQRIALARVILKDPKILILDEATSSVDSQSEDLLWDALSVLMKGRTTLLISHRLSSVVRADHVLVLQGGCVVASSSQEAIMKEEIFKELYHGQFIELGKEANKVTNGPLYSHQDRA